MGIIQIALKCTAAKAEERPGMRQVVEMLGKLRSVKPMLRNSNAKGKAVVGVPSISAGRDG